ncbi:MAG: UvrABC system protein C [Gammaproteobacteria bacterium]|nr:MAG: UvrABC system protein C [Gammaproteobacteria bacterium]
MPSDSRDPAGFDPAAVLARVGGGPGVYRLLDAGGQVLYVGKARNLRARLASHFRGANPSPRMQVMLAKVRDVEVTLTRTEGEALLLEATLIKRLKPRYNVVLRDDKSYPYIFLSTADTYPRLAFDRGRRHGPGRYFGPYPSAGAVRETLAQLQKLFRLRSCEDSVFRNRSRPCLEHQIGRCSAPCVGLVDPDTYRADVRHAEWFLEGRNDAVIGALVERMDEAARNQAYELAARYRDAIADLQRIREQQAVDGEHGDLDVLGLAMAGKRACVQCLTVRGGRLLGGQSFFPDLPENATAGDVLAAFLSQYYSRREPPPEILLPEKPAEADELAGALAERAGRRVRLVAGPRGRRRRLLEMARQNAAAQLALKVEQAGRLSAQFAALAEALGLARPLRRIDCFDVSHGAGEAPMAACVAFDENGPVKREWRRYALRGLPAGDDYAGIEQAVARRYRRVRAGELSQPDLVVIDGGAGQMARARAALAAADIDAVLLGMAKGPARTPGRERLLLEGRAEPLDLPTHHPARLLLQRIRDEAHRYALLAHRRRRAEARSRSPLEAIPGLGPKRAATLLKHFGGLQGLLEADVEALSATPGISRRLAERIHATLHAPRS